MTTNIPFADYLQICNVAFEWTSCYDHKDWERLEKFMASVVRSNYTALGVPRPEDSAPKDFVAGVAALIGDKRVKTQHLLGGSKWECLGDGRVHVSHQIRVAHQRYKDENCDKVINKGHAHGMTEVWYTKAEGSWKIAGVKPHLEWAEHDLFGTLAPPKEDESTDSQTIDDHAESTRTDQTATTTVSS